MSGPLELSAVAETKSAPPRTLELRHGKAAPEALAQLKEMAAGFESIFTSTLLGELLKPLDGAGLAGEGPGASVVQGLIESNLSDHLAKSGGLGIGRMLVQALEPLLAAQAISPEELASKLATAKDAAALPPEPVSGGSGIVPGMPVTPGMPGMKEDVR